jgi:pimeloyl-ACP methyl ester carboxylesterase
MHYLLDDFTDPWREAETILLLHGNCESGAAWYGWVPHLARQFRVVRPDMGLRRVHPGAAGPVVVDVVIDDFVKLMDTLGTSAFIWSAPRSPA